MHPYDCKHFGTGPIGTIDDGCGNDTFELATAIVITVLTAGVIIYYRATVPSICLSILGATSFYHALFGEGNTHIAEKEAIDKGVWRGLVLFLLNTREFTVLITVSVVTFLVWGYVNCIGKMLLSGYEALTVGAAGIAHLQTNDKIETVLFAYDVLGIAVALVTGMCVLNDYKYSHVKT